MNDTNKLYTDEEKEIAREELVAMRQLPEHIQPSLSCLYGRLQAILNDQLPKTFDWVKIANIIAERRPQEAVVGMEEDRFWTMNTVYKAGEGLCYPSVAASVWATPVIELDDNGELIPCWVEVGRGVSSEVWPDEAIAILANAGLMYSHQQTS